MRVAVPAAKPAAPAAKQGSLTGAIMKALGNDGDERKKRQETAEDQRVRAMLPQFQPQFQQLLYGELAFMRRVCKPEKKSFAEVAKAANAGLKAPMREYILAMYGSQTIFNNGASDADPRSAVGKLLLPLVKGKLSDEKYQLYVQERNKRDEAHQHAVVLNLVAGLDERLVLTTEQRAKLVQALSANYEHSWDQFFEVYGFGNQYLPSVRDKTIVALLDDQQKKVWNQADKISGRIMSGRIGGNWLVGAGRGDPRDRAHRRGGPQ